MTKSRITLLLGSVVWALLLPSTVSGQTRLRDLLPGGGEKASPADQAAPARGLPRFPSPFRRVNHEAQEQGLQLEMTHGPWLIMCASFIGEGRHQAEALCRELRSKGLEAYLYEHSFDYTQEIQGLGYSVKRTEGLVEQFDLEPAKMRAANPVRYDDVSVLVGHFSSEEDKRAKPTLDKIKSLFPKSLHVSENSRSFQRMSGYREWVRSVSEKIPASDADDKSKSLGPMRAAFLVPNPLLPDDFFELEIVDPIVVKMNKGDKYSLLENRKPYTVKVATFTGESTFNREEIEQQTREFEFLKRSGKGLTESRLMEAESNANYLTDLLRKEGWEAYSFHDRDSSIVCVGSFDWVVRNPDSPDKIINPEAQRVIDFFQAKVVNNIPGVAPFYQPRTVPSPNGKKKLTFDLIPVSVNVPRIR
jgi:hypothetical protein